MSQVYILWWESEDGEWDFVGAYATHEAAKEALGREQGWDPVSDYSITPLILKESK